MQLLFVHRCPHSDSSLLRRTVATSQRSSARFGPCASPPSHGGSTADNSAYCLARRSALRCALDACAADAPSAFLRPPAQVGLGASFWTASLPPAARSRAHGMPAARAEATAVSALGPRWHITGSGALLGALAGARGLRALQSSAGRQSHNSTCLRQVRRAPVHRRMLCRVSLLSIMSPLRIHVPTMDRLSCARPRQQLKKFGHIYVPSRH